MLYHFAGLRTLLLICENLLFNFVFRGIFKHRVTIFGFPIVSIAKSSEITVGENLVLISHSYFSEPGVNHPVIIRTINPNAIIRIGDNVGISGGGVIAAKQVVIGNNVMLGANALITDTDFHPIEPESRRFSREGAASEKIIIEDNVFVGMNSLVLKGVTIGCNSVIGAGSTVTKDIPPNCIAVGTPAKVIANIREQETDKVG